MKNYTINCDMGESFGRYRIADDEKLMPFINECNIACGFHAGDPLVIEQTIKMAQKYNVLIGAHPSFPDLQGFGRRNMDIAPLELESIIRYQVAAVKGIAESFGMKLNHVKAHGALYNIAMIESSVAEAVVRAVHSIDPNLILFAPYKSVQAEIALAQGMYVRFEAFIDRQYHKDLRLVSRKRKGALITDPELAAFQVDSLSEKQQVQSIEGDLVHLEADTLCIHGDNPSAMAILKRLKPACQ